MKKIVVIDGNNLAFVANMTKPLSTSDGRPTQAIKGFLNSLAFHARTFNPAEFFVCWDGGRADFRMAVHPEYKAGRESNDPAKEQLILQLPTIEYILYCMGIPQLKGEGVEADDLVATIVKTVKGQEVVIVSGDQDFYQLISPSVSVYSTLAGQSIRHITHKTIVEKTGLSADQQLDYKAMVGDKSDNIDGIPGVGKKTAKTILQVFGSYDAFREAVETKTHEPNAWEKKAYNGHAEYEAAKTLMDLSGDLPIVGANLKQGPVRIKQTKEVYELLEFTGFKKWLSSFKVYYDEFKNININEYTKEV